MPPAPDRPPHAPTAAPAAGLAIALDRREAISRKEFDDTVRRLTLACWIALLFWPAFGLLDLLVAWRIEPGNALHYLAVRAGACEVKQGTHESPTTTILMSDKDFLEMMEGKLKAMQAYTSGRLKIEGALMKSQLIEKLFKV